MALVPIKLNPGVNVQATPLLNEGSWSESGNVRWQYGLPQKTGGYVKFCQTIPGAGIPQSLRAWTALSSASYLAIACSRRLDVFANDQVFDITPNTASGLVLLSLSTTAGSSTVVITDALHTPAVGDWLQIGAPITISNLFLFGSYGVTAIGAGTYSIAVQTNAATSVVSGGNARQFTTTTGSRVVTVLLPNHGLFTGQVAPVPSPVTVGGITLQGNYIASVINQNYYTVTAASPAVSGTTVTENAGRLQVSFFNPASGTQVDFNAANATTANWGEFLMWCPQGGPVYVWQPAFGVGTPATDVTTAPQSNTVIFIATQQQMLFCCGTVNLATGLFDPMLVRWSDIGDYTDFAPTAMNQAGSFRLVVGSKIVGALPVAGGNLIWTDLALYSLQYLQPPLVWGFQPIGTNCGLVGPHAVGTMGSGTFWMSQQQFYALAGGTPQIIPCTVWDQVFKNLDPAKLSSVVCETNTFYNEVSWEVAQLDGTVVRARLQVDTGLWDYTRLPYLTDLPRTAWIDQSVFGPPLAASADGAVWQHEIGYNSGFDPLPWDLFTGIIMISEGDQFTFVREIKPDFKYIPSGSAGPGIFPASGSQGAGVVEMFVYFYGDPTDPPVGKGPFRITSKIRSVPVRGRGRGIQFQFRGRDLNSFVRFGLIRYRGQADGRR